MADMSIKLKERLALRINQEIGAQMDTIIEKVIVLARKYSLGESEKMEKSANSPFKNVLNVSVEPSSSLEVIKNFIRYQTGRKGGSEIWRKKGFADALVTDLDGLNKDVNGILERIKESYRALAFEEKSDLEHPMVSYIGSNSVGIKRSLHLQIVQLYLGYLSREHIASKGGVPGKVEPCVAEKSTQEKATHPPSTSSPQKNEPARPKKKGKC